MLLTTSSAARGLHLPFSSSDYLGDEKHQPQQQSQLQSQLLPTNNLLSAPTDQHSMIAAATGGANRMNATNIAAATAPSFNIGGIANTTGSGAGATPLVPLPSIVTAALLQGGGEGFAVPNNNQHQQQQPISLSSLARGNVPAIGSSSATMTNRGEGPSRSQRQLFSSLQLQSQAMPAESTTTSQDKGKAEGGEDSSSKITKGGS
jgi:hypothetical protein